MEGDTPERAIAATSPSGGTTTATRVTTWLIRLVRGRTVPTGTGAGERGAGAERSVTRNQYSQLSEVRSCGSRSSGAESPVSAPPTCSRGRTRWSCSSASSAPGGHANTRRARRARARHRLPRPQHAQLPAARPALLASSACARTPRRCRSRSSCSRCGLEYSGRRPFAQPRNLASPRFHGLLWEIGRWLRTAAPLARGGRLRERLARRLPRRARLLGSASARTSSSRSRRRSGRPRRGGRSSFPAAYAIRFFDNHGMLGLRPLPLAHGDAAAAGVYVSAIADRARRGGCGSGSAVRAIRRAPDGVELRGDGRRARSGSTRSSSRRTPTRRSRCSRTRARRSGARSAASPTPRNETVLHTDASLPAARARRARLLELPQRRARRLADAHLLPEPAAAARDASATTASP